MRALVVYESLFGNTRRIAEAIGEGLAEHLEVTLKEVSQAPAPIEELVDLVVVGGPTHAFSLTRPSTRANAFQQGASEGEEDYGLREWIAGLHRGPHSELVASFDTRVDKVRRMPGSAAKKADRLVRHLGYESAGRESFYVADTSGPLLPGEPERARAWGRRLGDKMAEREVGRAPAR